MSDQANTAKRWGGYLIEIDELYFEHLHPGWPNFTAEERQEKRQALVAEVELYMQGWSDKDTYIAYLGNFTGPGIKISPIDTNVPD